MKTNWYNELIFPIYKFNKMVEQFFLIANSIFTRKSLFLKTKEDILTAYADQERLSIVLDSKLYDGTSELFLKDMTLSEKLTAVDGILAHEAAHFQYSPATLMELLPKEISMNSFSATIVNIIEDLYIERKIFIHHANMFSLILAKNELLFDSSVINERYSLWNGEKPKTIEELEITLNVMITWIRTEVVPQLRTQFEIDLSKLVFEIFSIESIEERKKLNKKIYQFLIDEEEIKKNIGEEEKEECEGGDPFSDQNANSFGFITGKTYEEISNSKLFDTGGDSKCFGRETLEIVDFIQTDNEKIIELKVDEKNRRWNIRNTMDFSAIKELENTRSGVRRIKGAPKLNGRRITHPQNFGVDYKIYGENFLEGYRVGRGKPEIIFMIDLSGSMENQSTIVNTSKKKFALDCVYEINRMLRGTRIKYSFYTHHVTDYFYSDKTILIQCIKKPNESLNDQSMLNRLGHFNENTDGCNADSTILLYLSEKFDRVSEKVLFVISDGLPTYNSPIYNRKKGIYDDDNTKSTKSAVHMLRKSGIHVFSASIDTVNDNNCRNIYGEEYSFPIHKVDQLVQGINFALA